MSDEVECGCNGEITPCGNVTRNASGICDACADFCRPFPVFSSPLPEPATNNTEDSKT